MKKVLQYGEGNFLRSFVDLYFETLNREGGEWAVEIVKPIPFGSLDAFARQENRYHVILRGVKDGNAADQNVTARLPQEGTDYTLKYTDGVWLQGEDGYWYYQDPVAPGDSTGKLIESCVQLAGANVPDGYHLSLEIAASAIQSVPETVVADEWHVVLTGDKIAAADDCHNADHDKAEQKGCNAVQCFKNAINASLFFIAAGHAYALHDCGPERETAGQTHKQPDNDRHCVALVSKHKQEAQRSLTKNGDKQDRLGIKFVSYPTAGQIRCSAANAVVGHQ